MVVKIKKSTWSTNLVLVLLLTACGLSEHSVSPSQPSIAPVSVDISTTKNEKSGRRTAHEKTASVPANISTTKATKVAQIILGGTIEKAIPYHDKGSHQRIAVMSKISDNSDDHNLYVLEEFGGNYRIVWSLAECCCCFGEPSENFQIVDIDGDSNHELAYMAKDGGTMVQYSTLTVVSLIAKETFTVTSTFNTGETNEEITLSPNLLTPAGIMIKDWMEKKAIELKIISTLDISKANLDDPENASERWLKENGRMSDGKVKIYWYRGLAANLYKDSIETGFFYDGRTYISTFKGPTYCDDASKNKHYVVFVPEHLYGWIDEIKLEGNELVLRSHDEEAVFYFNPKTRSIRSKRKAMKF